MKLSASSTEDVHLPTDVANQFSCSAPAFQARGNSPLAKAMSGFGTQTLGIQIAVVDGI